jgi:hypothetical protein
MLSRVLLTFHTRSIGFPRYAGRLSDFWSDHPQGNRLGSLLTIGHVNSDALGLSEVHDPGTLQYRGMHKNAGGAGAT